MSPATTGLPSPLAHVTRHLFLSPHYDDVALSAGATVSLLAQHGASPDTLVVFGSEPDPSQPLTAFAHTMHEGWGLAAGEVVASRQAEEAAAAAILGTRTIVLPFRDAIYRGDLYRSDDDLFAHPAPEEATLAAAIVEALPLTASSRAATRIYAPLAIGRHVDHQIVFQAATDLATQDWDVWFYEDIPYALKPDALQSRLADLTPAVPLEPAALVPAGPGWEQKLDAVVAYSSQLETIFRQYVGVGTSRGEISAALAEYAARIGDGTLSERFWQLTNASRANGS